MSSIADAFKDDLEVIQKVCSCLFISVYDVPNILGLILQEPNMNPSRLAVLIESLASGADVFTSSVKPGTNEVNEMEIIVNAAEKREAAQADSEGDEDVEMADD